MMSDLRNWEVTRVMGRRRFVVTRGVMGLGLPMFFGMTFVANFFSEKALPSLRHVLFSLVVWCTMGAFFGLGIWWQSECSYRRTPFSGSVTNQPKERDRK